MEAIILQLQQEMMTFIKNMELQINQLVSDMEELKEQKLANEWVS